jgi:hypothetical protein
MTQAGGFLPQVPHGMAARGQEDEEARRLLRLAQECRLSSTSFTPSDARRLAAPSQGEGAKSIRSASRDPARSQTIWCASHCCTGGGGRAAGGEAEGDEGLDLGDDNSSTGGAW